MPKRNTKDVLSEGYASAAAGVNAAAGVTMDPKKKARQKAVDEAGKRLESIKAESIVDKLMKMKDTVAVSFDQLHKLISVKLDELKDLDVLIEDRKAMLQELYGIEAKAESLAALINTQEDLKAKYQAEMVALQEKLDAMEASAEESIAESENEAAARRRQAEADFQYEFDKKRKRAIEEAEYEDQQREKKNKEREEGLNAREAEISKKEEEVAELKAKVDAIPGQLASAKAEGEAAGKAAAGKEYGIEKAAIKREYDADLKVKENEANLLRVQLEAAKAQIVSLEGKLDAAYAKITEVANNASGAAAKAETIAALQKTIADNRTTK